ncbi:tyrosinase family protein, partial [Actinoplanes sp. NPDC024001]|uniref:tyrosinase family protein n=1 Tax=Actinoplanes sp. NPDC024001 TaxID=3154598 RepID=UPI0033F1EC7E
DGRAEIVVAADAPGSAFWVMDFDPEAGTWSSAEFRCSDSDVGVRLAVAGDVDGDGRAEIVVAADAPGSAFWVMDFDPEAGTWSSTEFRCSDSDVGVRLAVAGDVDGDGRAEIAVAADTLGSAFWVMKYNPVAAAWSHLSQIPGHSVEADFFGTELDVTATFAASGDFDGDGRAEIAVAPSAPGNALWVMRFHPAGGTWAHLSPLLHPLHADLVCSTQDVGARFAVAGDFEGDKFAKIAVGVDRVGSEGNDFWVMRWKPGPAVQIYVRRDAWALTAPWDPITLAYARGVRVMQGRPDADPTSWAYQAAIHATFEVPPAGAAWNQCQHRHWFFLPWHRMYLYYFERILRAAVLSAGGPADFALPYWDYDQPEPRDSLPEPFRLRNLPDGTPNPLFVPAPNRSAAFNAGARVDPRVASPSAALDLTDFFQPAGVASFGGVNRPPVQFGAFTDSGQLELVPHNAIHSLVGGRSRGRCEGGWLADPRCAARDPVFWVHHANIDRLWNSWLNRGGGRLNPTDPAWLGQQFAFADENGNHVVLSPADVVDSAVQLGYTYA